MDSTNRGTDEAKAPFNMAIDTLRSIRILIDEMSQTDSDPLLSPAQKQSINIPKVQSFFTTACALLEDDVIEKYKPIIEWLKPKQIEIPITRNGLIKRKETRLIYDETIEMIKFNLILDITRELKNGKYFMPPRKDLSRAITEM